MAYGQTFGLVTPLEDYAGYWLKCYTAGTTTPISMATDSDGGTLLAKAEVSSGGTVPIGFFQTAGSVVFNPHLNETYDAWLFPTEAEADSNTTTNAIQLADNIIPASISADTTVRSLTNINFATVAAMVADTDLVVGNFVTVEEYATASDTGVLFYEVVAAATGTADGGEFIDLTGTTLQAQAIFPSVIPSGAYGLLGDGTDETTQMQAFLDYLNLNGGAIEFDGTKTYQLDSPVTLLSTTTAERSWVVKFNACRFDCTNQTGADIAFRVGATSQSNAFDKEFIRLEGAPVWIGPESGNPQNTLTSATPTTTQADTTTIGLSIEFALNLVIDQYQMRRFYTGWTTTFTFPLTTRELISRENYIAAIIGDDSTRCYHLDAEFVECHYGLVVQPPADGTASNQVFDHPRFESFGVGIVIDQNDSGTPTSSVRSIEIRSPYFEAGAFDHVRIGVALNPTAAGRAVRGADRSNYIQMFELTKGFWSHSASWDSSASKSPVYCSTDLESISGGEFWAPAAEEECINLPQSFTFRREPDLLVSNTNNPQYVRNPGDGSANFHGARTIQTLTSVTRASATATATLTAHGYSNSDTVYITGANETEYNGFFIISNVTANTFDYTVTGTPATPATGTVTVVEAELNNPTGNVSGVAKTATGTYLIQTKENYLSSTSTANLDCTATGLVSYLLAAPAANQMAWQMRNSSGTLTDSSSMNLKISGIVK